MPLLPRKPPIVWRDRRGVVAVELALVLPVAFLMLFAIVELGLDLLTQTVLDHAVAVGARQVQLGNATTAASFTSAACAAAPIMIISCPTSIQVYVTSGSSFAALTPATISSAGVMSPTTFSAGSAGSNVLVEVVYSRAYFFKLLSTIMGTTNSTLLSTVALQSEPY